MVDLTLLFWDHFDMNTRLQIISIVFLVAAAVAWLGVVLFARQINTESSNRMTYLASQENSSNIATESARVRALISETALSRSALDILLMVIWFLL